MTSIDTPNLLVVSTNSKTQCLIEERLTPFIGQDFTHSLISKTEGFKNAEALISLLNSYKTNFLGSLMCLVDLTQHNASWDIEIPEYGIRPSELTLMYPTVYWVFLVNEMPKYPKELVSNNIAVKMHFVQVKEVSKILYLVLRHSCGFRTWFDPTGLRECIRSKGFNHSKTAISIDDENDYCSFNGYLLYINSYSVFTVNSTSEFKSVLNDRDVSPSLILEDVELNFFDLEHTDKEWLFSSTKSGKMRGPEGVLDRRNGLFKKEVKTSTRYVSAVSKSSINNEKYKVIAKPYQGLYDREIAEWISEQKSPSKQEGLWERIKGYRRQLFSSWQITSGRNLELDSHSVGNSRAQHIASALLRQSKLQSSNIVGMTDALQAALLASDAERLLKGESVIISLEAIAQKHKMEVMAECMYIGSASELQVRDRFKRVKQDVDKVLPKHSNRDIQRYSALIKITDEIRLVYKRFDQFAEERKALEMLDCYEIRRECAQYRVMLNSSATLPNALRILLAPIDLTLRKYLSILMRGPLQLLCSIILWVVVFAVFFLCLFENHTMPVSCIGSGLEGVNQFITLSEMSIFDWLLHSAANFFGGGLSIIESIEIDNNCVFKNRSVFYYYWSAAISQVIIGAAHLGVFITILYERTTRRG